MVSLKLQKRLAASVLKCGARKIWMDPNEVRLCQNLRGPEPVNSWRISQPPRLCRSGDVSANDHVHQQCLFLRTFCFAALRDCIIHRLSLFLRCSPQAQGLTSFASTSSAAADKRNIHGQLTPEHPQASEGWFCYSQTSEGEMMISLLNVDLATSGQGFV